MIPHYLMLRDSIYLEGGIVKSGFGIITRPTRPLIIKIELLKLLNNQKINDSRQNSIRKTDNR